MPLLRLVKPSSPIVVFSTTPYPLLELQEMLIREEAGMVEFRVQGAGCRVRGAGCRVQGLGSRAQPGSLQLQIVTYACRAIASHCLPSVRPGSNEPAHLGIVDARASSPPVPHSPAHANVGQQRLPPLRYPRPQKVRQAALPQRCCARSHATRQRRRRFRGGAIATAMQKGQDRIGTV